MKALNLVAIAILFLPLVGAAQHVSSDFDKTANFTTYKTYVMREGTKVGDPVIDDPITAAIEAELAAKDLKKADTADIAVVYHFAVDREKDITSWSQGSSPYAWHWGDGWDKTDVRLNFIYAGRWWSISPT
jgi:hypothetical protein